MAAFESAHRGKAGGASVATFVAQAAAARQTVSSPARAEHPAGDFGAVRVRDAGDSMYDTRRSLVASFGPGARDVPIDIASDQARGAEGVTQGRRVHLAPGRFTMQSRTGQVLLGHEVAHALQQRRGEGLTSPLADSERAALEAEAEQAGHAFADGRTFAVTGRAPAAALYRGPDDEPQQAIADIEFDAVMQKVLARQVARGLSIASARKSRLEYLRAHRAWREIDVPVDDRLRKLSPMQQWHELNLRLLETVFPSITRPDAEELLRRLHWRAHETGDAKLAAMIQTQDKINYRTQDIEIAAEIYNHIEEDRRLADINLDERLNNGYDYSLEIFKDVGRSYYNGALSFGQGLVDLPAAPVNLVQTLRGEEPVHLLNLDSLRARYHTGWGLHQGHSAELGVNLALTVVSGKLPTGGAGGAGAAANTASTVSRAARLYAAWSKLSAVTSGATAVVQAGQALRDLARGYVVVDGKQRPLTDDDIVDRLASIAFGAHTAKSVAGGRKGEAEKSGTAGQTRPEPPGMAVEHPTPTSVVVSVKGEPARLVLDESGWRVVGADGKTLRSGPPDEGASIAAALGSPADVGGASTTPPAGATSPIAGHEQPVATPKPASETSVSVTAPATTEPGGSAVATQAAKALDKTAPGGSKANTGYSRPRTEEDIASPARSRGSRINRGQGAQPFYARSPEKSSKQGAPKPSQADRVTGETASPTQSPPVGRQGADTPDSLVPGFAKSGQVRRLNRILEEAQRNNVKVNRDAVRDYLGRQPDGKALDNAISTVEGQLKNQIPAKPPQTATINSREEPLPNGGARLVSEGRVGEPPDARPGVEKKYPSPSKVGLPGYVRFHVEGIKAIGDELNVVYAPERFNISETARIENQIRQWRDEIGARGGELHYEITADTHVHGVYDGVTVKILDRITWKLERRIPGTNRFEPVFEYTATP